MIDGASERYVYNHKNPGVINGRVGNCLIAESAGQLCCSATGKVSLGRGIGKEVARVVRVVALRVSPVRFRWQVQCFGRHFGPVQGVHKSTSIVCIQIRGALHV